MTKIDHSANVPNLDGMIVEDVRDWFRQHHPVQNTRPLWEAVAAGLFPGKPKGYRRATQKLVRYAGWKAKAMRLRAEGNIPEAMRIERNCDLLYKELPKYARW